MKKLLGMVLGTGLLFAVAGAAFAVFKQREILHFREAIPGYYAKQMCSCHFVMQMAEAECLDWVNVYLQPKKIEVDEVRQAVRAQALGFTALAEYQNKFFGCRLTQIGPTSDSQDKKE